MSFIAELKRRKVFKVGAAYLIGAWVLIQVADILLDNQAAFRDISRAFADQDIEKALSFFASYLISPCVNGC